MRRAHAAIASGAAGAALDALRAERPGERPKEVAT
jgi:hypothetical protein